ncbi:hypothetical protein [Aliiroseovarius halocynthiae]|uniref:Uncharacterized protein n=1 Tax=Aliiroseovarius halocynthiae TaxID=985055 RepID=A0A545SQ41_9RHOB|nr:hypothetical protein [Aliiroseovarius halocynthiae]TQV67077.1 hypothetical protein FIL88_10850 [Aliiroseovarius halocynthiae]
MDGVDDSLATDPILKLGNPLTIVIGYQMISAIGTQRVNFVEISKDNKNATSFGAQPLNDRLQFFSRIDDQGVGISHIKALGALGGHTRHVATLQATSGQVVIRLDGTVVQQSTQILAGEFLDAQAMRVGLGVSTASIPGAFRLYGMQVWDGAETQPDTAQIEQLEGWMAEQIGVTI